MPRTITIPEMFLGIAALLIIIAGAWDRTAVLVVIGLIIGTSAIISMGLVENPLFRDMFSLPTVSATFGILLLAWWGERISDGLSKQGITWVIFASSLLALFAAFIAMKPAPAPEQAAVPQVGV